MGSNTKQFFCTICLFRAFGLDPTDAKKPHPTFALGQKDYRPRVGGGCCWVLLSADGPLCGPL